MAGKLRNCPICNSPYIDTGGGACSDCVGQLEGMKAKVLDYVDTHPNAQISEIVRNTNVSEESVKRLFTDGEITYPCARCGTSILEGKYCRACLEALRKSLDKAALKKPAKEEAKKNGRGSRMNMIRE